MESLNQYFDANYNTLDWLIFDLMKSTSDIYSKSDEISDDSIDQIQVVINSLQCVVNKLSNKVM